MAVVRAPFLPASPKLGTRDAPHEGHSAHARLDPRHDVDALEEHETERHDARGAEGHEKAEHVPELDLRRPFVVEGVRLDTGDRIGAALCLAGVAVIMGWRRD